MFFFDVCLSLWVNIEESSLLLVHYCKFIHCSYSTMEYGVGKGSQDIMAIQCPYGDIGIWHLYIQTYIL